MLGVYWFMCDSVCINILSKYMIFHYTERKQYNTLDILLILPPPAKIGKNLTRRFNLTFQWDPWNGVCLNSLHSISLSITLVAKGRCSPFSHRPAKLITFSLTRQINTRVHRHSHILKLTETPTEKHTHTHTHTRD